MSMVFNKQNLFILISFVICLACLFALAPLNQIKKEYYILFFGLSRIIFCGGIFSMLFVCYRVCKTPKFFVLVCSLITFCSLNFWADIIAFFPWFNQVELSPLWDYVAYFSYVTAVLLFVWSTKTKPIMILVKFFISILFIFETVILCDYSSLPRQSQCLGLGLSTNPFFISLAIVVCFSLFADKRQKKVEDAT